MKDQSQAAGPNPDHRQSADSSYQFRLLGSLEIARAGAMVPPPPHRARNLLAALLLNPQPVRRERLAGLLLPDLPEATGRRRLSDLLWLLRRALPHMPLHADNHEVFLSGNGRWLDVEAFRVAAGSEELSDWLAAIALYRGPLLEETYDDWLLVEREGLYLQYLHLLHRVCETYLQQREFDAVLPYAERLVQAEPYDERALRTLLQAYRAVGKRGAALAAFDRFVALVAHDLSIEPEPATRALADAIRSGSGQTRAVELTPVAVNDHVALLQQAHAALVRCDRTAVAACLERLRRNPDTPPEATCLLEIDLALLYEEHDRAAAQLQRCRSDGVPQQVRSARLLLAQRSTARARDVAAHTLMLAHQAGDQAGELDALLVLAQAQQQLGQNVQSVRSTEQALRLARQLSSPAEMAQALSLQGYALLYQGRYDRALPQFHEARSVALEHSLPYQLAIALGGVRAVLCYTNRLREARKVNEEELSIWRDLALLHKEASALEGLVMIEDLLGNSANSLRILEQATVISRQLDQPVRLATNQYNLAFTMLYLDDALASGAIENVSQALATFREYGQAGWEAAALAILGYALWVDGQHAAALERLQEAYLVAERAGELACMPEILAYQGLACLGLDRPREALALTQQAVLAMAQGEVSREAVHEIYYAQAMAMFANDDNAQGRIFLQRAYDHLLENATHLEEGAARQAYFQHNPTTRRLMQALVAREMVPPPAAGVVSQRLPAAKSGRSVPVRWTVDAGPADVALKRSAGPIALRRSRLARLLQEASAQGAQPTAAQLAAALNVSKRTIERDLSFLRRKDRNSQR